MGQAPHRSGAFFLHRSGLSLTLIRIALFSTKEGHGVVILYISRAIHDGNDLGREAVRESGWRLGRGERLAKIVQGHIANHNISTPWRSPEDVTNNRQKFLIREWFQQVAIRSFSHCSIPHLSIVYGCDESEGMRG